MRTQLKPFEAGAEKNPTIRDGVIKLFGYEIDVNASEILSAEDASNTLESIFLPKYLLYEYIQSFTSKDKAKIIIETINGVSNSMIVISPLIPAISFSMEDVNNSKPTKTIINETIKVEMYSILP